MSKATKRASKPPRFLWLSAGVARSCPGFSEWKCRVYGWKETFARYRMTVRAILMLWGREGNWNWNNSEFHFDKLTYFWCFTIAWGGRGRGVKLSFPRLLLPTISTELISLRDFFSRRAARSSCDVWMIQSSLLASAIHKRSRNNFARLAFFIHFTSLGEE